MPDVNSCNASAVLLQDCSRAWTVVESIWSARKRNALPRLKALLYSMGTSATFCSFRVLALGAILLKIFNLAVGETAPSLCA